MSQSIQQIDQIQTDNKIFHQQRQQEHQQLTTVVNDHQTLLANILERMPSSNTDMSHVPGDPEKALGLEPSPSLPMMQIRGGPLRQSNCKPPCSCPCHSLKFFAPSQSLLGSLFAGYSNFPQLTARCTDPACRREQKSVAILSYIFPSWVCARRVLAYMCLAKATTPQFSLRFSSVLPANADVFVFAANGNIAGLKELFMQRKASPHDTDSAGRTPLQVEKNSLDSRGDTAC